MIETSHSNRHVRGTRDLYRKECTELRGTGEAREAYTKGIEPLGETRGG